MRAWLKHTVVIFISMSVGFVMVSWIADQGWISETHQRVLNIVLNYTAVGYAILLAKMAEDNLRPFVDAAKRMGIDPPSAEGIMMYFTEKSKPVLDAIDRAGLTSDRILGFLNTIPNLMDMAERISSASDVLERTEIDINDDDYLMRSD